MEIEHQDQLINIINNLSSSNTRVIKQAQKQLYSLQSHPSFLKLLINLLRSGLEYNLKKMVAICLQKFIHKYKQSMGNDLIKLYLELISSSFACTQLDFKIKLILAEACTILLKKDQQKSLPRQGLKTIQSTLQNIQSLDLSDTDVDFPIVFATMLLNCLTKQHNKPQLLFMSDSLVQLALKMFQLLSKHIGIRPHLEIQNILVRCQHLLLLNQFIIDTLGKEFLQNNGMDPSKFSQKLTFLHNFLYEGFYLFDNEKVHRFFWLQAENSKINQYLNSFKKTYLQLLTSFIEKVPLNPQSQASNIINLIQQIAKDTIFNLQNIFLSRQIYQGTVGVDQVIEKEILLLISVCMSSEYKAVIYTQRIKLIRTIYKIFDFSVEDIDIFKKEPYVFVNNIFRIIEVSIDGDENENSIKLVDSTQKTQPVQLQNVKILGAKLFKLILTLQYSIVQGVCKEIINQIYAKIRSKSQKISKLTLILCIIRDCVQNRVDILVELCRVVLVIGDNMLPMSQKEFYFKPIDYALGLFALSSYLKPINQRSPQLLQKILQLSVNLISQKSFPQVHRILGQEIIQNIYQIYDDNYILIQRMLEELNRRIIILTNNGNITYNILESLFFSIEQISKRKKLQAAFLIPQKLKIVGQILNTLRHCIQIELKKSDYDKLIVNKCWNIIKLVGQNEVFVLPLISTLESVINHLIDYISIYKKIDFQQDCFLLMTSFIQHSQKISDFVLGLFQLIPSIFYGQYRGKFGHSFQAMQMLIYYGKNVLMHPKREVLTSILQMSLQSLVSNDFECIQGVLLLQSLMLTVQDGIGPFIWKIIIDKTKKKLSQAVNIPLLYQNLLGLLGICYVKASADWYEFYELNQYIRLCSQVITRCTNDYCLKVITFSFAQIILKNQKRFLEASKEELKTTLQHLIKAKWCHQDKKDMLHGLSERQNEKQFEILKSYTVNKVTKLNFADYFKQFTNKFFKNVEHFQDQFAYLCILKPEDPKEKLDLQIQKVEIQKKSSAMNRRHGLK